MRNSLILNRLVLPLPFWRFALFLAAKRPWQTLYNVDMNEATPVRLHVGSGGIGLCRRSVDWIRGPDWIWGNVMLYLSWTQREVSPRA